MMNRYEMIYIIDTGLEEAARKELIERVSGWITGNGGEIEKIDETWGKHLQINENVLRYLVVKVEEKRSSVKPRPVRPVAAPAEEAPAAPVEEAPVEAPVEEAPVEVAPEA